MTGFWQSVAIIAAAAVTTAATRFAPFLLFDRGGEPPKWIKYLGSVLPAALMSVLLIYCLKDVNALQWPHGIPEFIGIAVAVGLHIWRGNVLLSIGVSTVLYMVLVQTLF